MAKLNSGTRIYGNTAIDTFLTVSGAVASTSNTTGTIIVTGGVGVSGNVYANGIYSNDKLGIGLTSAISSWTKLEIKGTAGSQVDANQQLSIQAPTTTAGQGAGIRLSAASGANEAVGIIGVVNNASGTAGAMTFHVYNGGATVPEYMRLDNAGNLGIGVAAPSEKLAIDGNVIMTGNRALILQNTGVAAGTISFRNSSGVQKSAIGSYYNIADEGDLEFINVGTTNMILRSTGRLGLGITAPTELLHISGTSAISGATHGPRINLQYTGTSGAAESRINFLDFRGTINASIGNYLSDDGVSTYAADLVFKTAVAGVFDERMRLSSGNLLVGTTTKNNDGKISISASSALNQGITIKETSATNDIYYILFTNSAGATAGRIEHTGATTVNYTSGSDVRLKTNIVDAGSAKEKIEAIKIREFDWITGEHQKFGVIAQELIEVAPEAVCAGRTENDHWGVDYSKLVPSLIKYVQEQQALITQLTARITALEGA